MFFNFVIVFIKLIIKFKFKCVIILIFYIIRINNRISATKLKFNCYNKVVLLNIKLMDKLWINLFVIF